MNILSLHRCLSRRSLGILTAIILLTFFSLSAYADNPGTGTTGNGQTLTIEIDESIRGASILQAGEPLSLVGTTKIGTIGERTNILYVVDVSLSTEEPADQDCDGNGAIDGSDNINGDGTTGDTLDCEISGIIALNESLPSSADSSVGLVLFARTALIADMNPAEGQQRFTSPFNTDKNSNQQVDLSEVARSLDQHRINLFDSGSVRGGTYFDAAITAINKAFESAEPGTNIVFFLSDGDHNGGDFSVPLAEAVSSGIIINTYSIGENGTGCGDDANLNRIATETGGACTEVLEPSQLREELPGTSPQNIERVDVVAGSSGLLTTTLDALGNWAVEIPENAVAFPLSIVATVYADDGTEVNADILIEVPMALDVISEPNSGSDQQLEMNSKFYLPLFQ